MAERLGTVLDRATIERITGVLFLIIIPVSIATTLLDSGVDTRVDEFRGSLHTVADNETQNILGAVFGFLLAGLVVSTGAALYVTFPPLAVSSLSNDDTRISPPFACPAIRAAN